MPHEFFIHAAQRLVKIIGGKTFLLAVAGSSLAACCNRPNAPCKTAASCEIPAPTQETAMSFEITNPHKEHVPALRLIGKRYTRGDDFGAKHREWSENLLCQELAKLGFAETMTNGMHGLMTLNADYENQPEAENQFAYWIGYLFPAGTPVPDGYGFSSFDLPESDLGVVWIRGKCPDVFGVEPHNAALAKVRESGLGKLRENAGGENTLVFFERYNPKRFQPDAQGNVVLDYGFYLAD
jgi:hypothetical protein